MIPLWIKDRSGNWCNFPDELRQTLSDGSLGYKREWGSSFSPYFQYYRDKFETMAISYTIDSGWISHCEYRLKKQP